MKCANCDRPGLYVYEGPGVRPVAYCAVDLPGFLRASARSGALRTTKAFDQVRQNALASLSPTQVIAVAPAPEPEPEPQPKKTRSRKKSAPAPDPVEEAAEEPTEPVVEEPVEPPVEEPVEEPTEG